MNNSEIIILGGIIGLISIGIGLKKYGEFNKTNHSKKSNTKKSNHSKKSNTKKNKDVESEIIIINDILLNIKKEAQTIKLENEYNILDDILFNDQMKPQGKTNSINLKNRFDKDKTELKTLRKEITEFKKNPNPTEKEYEKISKKLNSLTILKQNTRFDFD
jgi:hypothetical protein